ncbi:TetR/AcrR family transcriptional regulator [Pseudactinotalea suaedae]|uniref:TetR/AcrR family transcriptional regulator n=1 Tax=Pseudactinotalea suaedae TaxID=1524924 RepID=UPI0012E32749|nr:TetR/AcrR family transcriptional regulator [Pseudactinotalea suaedae]
MPKIIGSTLAEHREQVRTRLFSALARLMDATGFDTLTMSDIAAEAGVGRTSVYNHFADKESLLIGYIEHETGAFLVGLREALEGVTDPEERLRVYIRQQMSLTTTYHPAPGPDLRSLVSRDTVARLREHVREVELLLREILTDGVEAGRLPEQDVDSVVPLVHACLTGRAALRDPGERDRAVSATEEFVLRAVGAA